jgi:hypothetical protein
MPMELSNNLNYIFFNISLCHIKRVQGVSLNILSGNLLLASQILTAQSSDAEARWLKSQKSRKLVSSE